MTLRVDNSERRRPIILASAHRDFEKSLTTHAFFKVHNRATSEDLVQDTFLKTWVYLMKGGRIETMKAFLYHVLNNLIVDEYRKRKTVPLDTLLEKGFEPKTTSVERIFDVLDGKIAILLIARLPEKYKGVMQMRYIKNLSLKEISLITVQSKNTVAVQIHRGLEKLKILYYRK